VAASHAFLAARIDDNRWLHGSLLKLDTPCERRLVFKPVVHRVRLQPDPIVQSPLVRIAIGADHAGFFLKEHLKATLQRLGHSVDDHGTHDEEPVDYPPICLKVARRGGGRADRGIVSAQRQGRIAANRCGTRGACAAATIPRVSRANTSTRTYLMGGRIVAARQPTKSGTVARYAV
jgi:ribose 5-phosphate isomerase B